MLLAFILAAIAGGGAWLLNRPPSGALPARPTASAAPAASACPPNPIRLQGSLQDCAILASAPTPMCAVGGGKLDAVFTLRGLHEKYLLYLEVDTGFQGAGVYGLGPGQHPGLGVSDDTPKVAVREYTSGNFWESESGSLDVYAGAAAWGFVTATLDSTGDGSTLALRQVHLSGVWRCP